MMRRRWCSDRFLSVGYELFLASNGEGDTGIAEAQCLMLSKRSKTISFDRRPCAYLRHSCAVSCASS